MVAPEVFSRKPRELCHRHGLAPVEVLFHANLLAEDADTFTSSEFISC